jgi:molybdopterin synthase sulfur carrier subunit
MPVVLVQIPTALGSRLGKSGDQSVHATTVAEAIQELNNELPALEKIVFQSPGRLRGFINLYVNDTDIRDLEGLATDLTDGDRIAIVPAVAGG